VVPLINEVFHTAYPEDVKIVQLRNEHQLEDGEIITDSCLRIGDMLYHIEVQTVNAIRNTILQCYTEVPEEQNGEKVEN